MNIIYWLAALGQIIWIISYIPQVVKTYKTKSAKDVSMLTYLLFLVGYLTTLPLLVINNVRPLLEGYLVSTTVVLIEILFIIIYGGKDVRRFFRKFKYKGRN